jgi:hypothetical protein
MYDEKNQIKLEAGCGSGGWVDIKLQPGERILGLKAAYSSKD